MLKLTNPAAVNEFFSTWYDLTEAQRLETIRTLKTIGSLSIVYTKPNSEPDFVCPLNSFALARPCELSSCQYYIGPKKAGVNSKKRPKAETLEAQQIAAASCKNCLIMCLDQSKNGRLSAQEVATVMGISVSEVNSINNNAIAKIRRATIKEWIEKLQLPRFKYLRGFCVSCGQNIEEELELNVNPDLNIVLNAYGWCSEMCRDDKPKWQFQLERTFECDYLDVLAIGLKVHGNLETLGNIFNISNDLLKVHKKDILKRQEKHKFF